MRAHHRLRVGNALFCARPPHANASLRERTLLETGEKLAMPIAGVSAITAGVILNEVNGGHVCAWPPSLRSV
jgi:hypothetical protein